MVYDELMELSMVQMNHLSEETSPYLQQHAHNPVNWYPWNQEALDLAKSQNKPILLSIGYAACHWCHVMAHESFEDETTAKLMNELFVSIKVDREERPDLDKIYQTAHYLLTQRQGGWPLTIFLSPKDLVPFFSGTYFPREAKYQLPSFKEVLQAIADIYKNNSNDIQQQNQQLATILNYASKASEKVQLSNQPLELVQHFLEKKFDSQYGGFGGAPKFPHPTIIELLLQKHSPMAETSLRRMAAGGMYDQLQGGFFRYAVDRKWEIPHFEKMLYDNGQLLFLYAQASHLFHDAYFAQIARETADWAINVMQSPEGGYFSSLNADSEGHEGKFYIWNKFEIEELLTENEARFAESYFGLENPPNFEKHWHLHVSHPLESIAKELQISGNDAEQLLVSIKQKLLMTREKRIHPSQDNKILTSWNALMIKGMSIAGDILQEPRYLMSAQKALEFIQDKLWSNNRLLASYNEGKAKVSAYLDDYAFLLDTLIQNLQVKWNTKNLEFAIQLAENLITHFTDKENGGFFFTSDDQEKVLYRPKTMMDEAIPAGNAIAARALNTLGHLLGETRYLDAAENTLKAAWSILSQYPGEHCSLLLALQDYLNPSKIIIIRGPENEIKTWRDFYINENRVHNIVFAIPTTEHILPGLLSSRSPQGKICAYICQGTQCLSITDQLKKI